MAVDGGMTSSWKATRWASLRRTLSMKSTRNEGSREVAGAIPEKWMKKYVDQLLEIAAKFPPGRMRDAALLRADHVMDMVKAYREHAR